MKIKVCFNKEIHKVPKLPATLEGFIRLADSLFKGQLPKTVHLQYMDTDGDKILINDEKDYEEFKKLENQDSAVSVKVHISAIDDFNMSDVEIIDDSSNKQEEEYQIIDVQSMKKTNSEDYEQIISKDSENLSKKKSAQFDKKVEEAKSDSNKGNVDVNTLEKLVSGMIDKSLPKIVELTQKQIDDQKQPSNILVDSKSIILSQEAIKPSEPQAVHYGITCQGCQMMPIVGARYKCTVCPNLDYCEKCEKNNKHFHDFVKMKQCDLFDMYKPSKPVVEKSEPVIKKNFDQKAEEYFKINSKKGKNRKESGNNLKNNKEKSAPAEAVEANYFDSLMEKAKKLHKCFPKAEFEILCAYVNEAPEDMSLEELVENFKH